MPKALVQVERVSLAHAGQPVLTEVSLSVHAGRIVTIVGPNGAGKSTLVKIALGLVVPDAGRVVRAHGLRLGYVPQRLNVDPALPLSVGRFLAMADPTLSPAQLAAALERVGAGHVLSRQMHDLSGGEQQRTMLARALLRRPDLLVLDEPVGGVDMTGQAEIYDLIGTQAREGTGVLLVSHDLHVVMAATDEVVCLNNHVCCAGHPEAVSRHPEYLALFGPRVASSLAVYTHVHDHAHLPDGTVCAQEGAHKHGPHCSHG